MDNTHKKTSLEKSVMGAIREGRVRMRPRWKFVLSGILAGLGGVIILFTLLYIASFAIFTLRQSGALFVPIFGMRGLFAFFAALPIALIVLLVLFTVTLEILVRRYRVGYRTPLLVSVFAILLIVLLGGYAIERTKIHHQILLVARGPGLPSPIAIIYKVGGQPVPGIYHGTVASFFPGGFMLVDENGVGTTTVVVDPHTRLPLGGDFSVGENVVVFGDQIGTSTVHAFGVRDADD
ncbi:MAG TPA: hypothetical protein VMU25_02620 [Candidatus Paceibacterota bacterium]|nr:hypothetical protein [Candidatus Paceibacterota bacterium]